MDPKNVSQQPSNSTSPPAPLTLASSKSVLPKTFNYFYLLLIIPFLFIISASAYFFILKYNNFPPKPSQTSKPQVTKGVIAKVGDEFIYKKDLEIEVASYPPDKNIDIKKILIEKIATDSAILQGAQADKFITLDQTVYNSPNKDYFKRMKLIEQIKDTVTKQSNSISGSFVAVWFYNNYIGPLGYEKGKELAFLKISKLHNEVKSGKITIEQAGEQIKKDTTLAQIDKSYKSNAIANFRVGKGETISFSPDFNALLWNLKAGEVSDIYLAKDKPRRKTENFEAVYLFGQISQKIENSKFTSFSDWVAQKKKSYEIIYY